MTEPKTRTMLFENVGDLVHFEIAASPSHFESEDLVLLGLAHMVEVPDLALLDVQTAPAQSCSSSAELLLHLEA